MSVCRLPRYHARLDTDVEQQQRRPALAARVVVPAIEEATQTTAVSNTFGAVAESWIRDPEGNRVDITEHGWPI